MAKLGFILMFVCTFFTAFGQFFLKRGMDNFSLLNIHIYIGILLYGLGAAVMILALRHGDLSSLYPIISLTFIWVIFLSAMFLGEKITVPKILGTGTILCGVVLISRETR
jgi:uncharacterized membrane protein